MVRRRFAPPPDPRGCNALGKATQCGSRPRSILLSGEVSDQQSWDEADALSLKLCDLASSHMRQVYCLDWLGQQPSISPQKRADNRLLYDEKARILIARTCRQNPAVNRAQLSVRAVGLYDATRRSEQANEATYQQGFFVKKRGSIQRSLKIFNGHQTV